MRRRRMTNEVIDNAIDNINDMISVKIRDMAIGEVYVASGGSLTLALITLVKELEKRKTPVKKVKKK